MKHFITALNRVLKK